METSKSPRVVIVGAGFGGLYAYLQLHRELHGTSLMQISLINDGDRFEFIPLVHEVATGTLLPSGVYQPIRTIPYCCLNDFIEGRAVSVDFDRQMVHLADAGKTEVPYDYLVLGLGSATNYFDVPGAVEYTLPLKSLKDAIDIKNNILLNFEKASETTDLELQKKLLRFVVVGGGPTGVELAGEIGDLIQDELKGAFPRLHGLPSVILIERGNTLLKKGVHEWFGREAHRILEKKLSVYVMTGTSVKEVQENGLQTDDAFIEAGLMIWAAGVNAAEIPLIASKNIVREENSGRIEVNNFLQIPNYPNAYVVGDQAWIVNKEGGQPYPMRAQFALREGKVAGYNVAQSIGEKPPIEFRFREKAFIVSLGKGGALAEVFGFRFTGPIAWAIYRGAYLASTIGLRSKARIFIEWLLNLFLPRDISKL